MIYFIKIRISLFYLSLLYTLISKIIINFIFINEKKLLINKKIFQEYYIFYFKSYLNFNKLFISNYLYLLFLLNKINI
jgi:hypothetical protein